MKLLCIMLTLVALAGCKKEADPFSQLCPGGCYDVPADFYFIIAESTGTSLLLSTQDEVTVAYLANGQLQTLLGSNHPFKTITTDGPASTDYLLLDRTMAVKSQNDNIKTFFLTFRGRTDTLGLDIRKVPATAANGGNSMPIVTFNGRLMQSVKGGNGNTPDYYVLKRR